VEITVTYSDWSPTASTVAQDVRTCRATPIVLEGSKVSGVCEGVIPVKRHTSSEAAPTTAQDSSAM